MTHAQRPGARAPCAYDGRPDRWARGPPPDGQSGAGATESGRHGRGSQEFASVLCGGVPSTAVGSTTCTVPLKALAMRRCSAIAKAAQSSSFTAVSTPTALYTRKSAGSPTLSGSSNTASDLVFSASKFFGAKEEQLWREFVFQRTHQRPTGTCTRRHPPAAHGVRCCRSRSGDSQIFCQIPRWPGRQVGRGRCSPPWPPCAAST